MKSNPPVYILGVACYYHDSAACILKDGNIVAAAQEERFTRKKHDADFPHHAINYCLKEAGICAQDLSYIAFYEKPIVKFDRILQTCLAYAPRSFRLFMRAMPLWLKDRLWIKSAIKKELPTFSGTIIFPTHHESHAASAFYPSPFSRAAIITIDAVGEWHTTTFGIGSGAAITLQKSINFPHSLGMLYSACAYYCGFKVNSGENKLMGLAPYGTPRYADIIRSKLVTVYPDGSFELALDYFAYGYDVVMTTSAFHDLFGGPPRDPEGPIEERHMDIAASIQQVVEEIITRIAQHVRRTTGEKNLVMAGGVALNCASNGTLLRKGMFDNIWIQPAAGDAGGALGAALFTWHQHLKHPRTPNPRDDMRAGYLGPAYDNETIERALVAAQLSYERVSPVMVAELTADLLAKGNIVGWFQGRMEYGPRALGARSIIGDPRKADMQQRMNLNIKFRESFRPFAPSVLESHASEYFTHGIRSPYMLFTFEVDRRHRQPIPPHTQTGLALIDVLRSDVPAITHVDYSARIQTVAKEEHGRYYDLIEAFRQKTGCPLIINTSFNVRGEPIVCTPEDAIRCFINTKLEYLVIGDYVVKKCAQRTEAEMIAWASTFEKD